MLRTLPWSCWLFVAAISLQAAGARAQSIDELRKAAKANRRSIEAQAAYGRGLILVGQLDQAERQMKYVSRMQRDSEAGLYLIAEVAFARGSYNQARKACRAMEKESANGLYSRVCRARAYLVWNRAGRAFDELEAALKDDPKSFEALLALGDAYRLRSAGSESEAAYRRAIASDPSRHEPHRGLGMLYVLLGKPTLAVASLQKATAMQPLDTEALLALASLLPVAESLPLLRRVVAIRNDWAQAQLDLGTALASSGDVAGARKAFHRALKLDFNLAAAHTGLGRLHAAAGEGSKALAEFQAALKLVPNDGAAMLAIGELQEAEKKHLEAYQAYEQAAGMAPNDPRALLRAAALALKEQRSMTARAYLERLRRNPLHADLAAAYALYGDILVATGDRLGAIEMYEKALKGKGELDRERVQTAIASLKSK